MFNKKQRKCLELMAMGDLTQRSIAVQIKVSEQTICNWKKNDEFMNELDSMVKVGIRSLAAKAYKTQKDLLDSNTEMVRYLASKDILDRAGFKATENFGVIRVGPVQIIDNIPDVEDLEYLDSNHIKVPGLPDPRGK
jgi:DNA-binding XRE family transcriptional regulator